MIKLNCSVNSVICLLGSNFLTGTGNSNIISITPITPAICKTGTKQVNEIINMFTLSDSLLQDNDLERKNKKCKILF